MYRAGEGAAETADSFSAFRLTAASSGRMGRPFRFFKKMMLEKKNETLKNVKRFFISNEMGAEQYFEQFEKGEMISYEEMAD